jgi:hypothetical protein
VKEYFMNMRITRAFGLIALLFGTLALMLVLMPLYSGSSNYYSPVLLWSGTFIFLASPLFILFPGKDTPSVREYLEEDDSEDNMDPLSDDEQDGSPDIVVFICLIWGGFSFIFSIYFGFFYF